MARYRARVHPAVEGGWVAVALELPHCWSRAAERDDALARLRDEIRYRIEYCPCTGVEDDFVQLEVVDEAASRAVEAAAPERHSWKSSQRGDPARFAGVAGCPGPRRAEITESTVTVGEAAGLETLGRPGAAPRAARVSPRPLGPQEMRRILAATDALGIHRESVSIPLMPRGEGSVRVSTAGRSRDRRSRSRRPRSLDRAIAAVVGALDLAHVRRVS